MSNKEFAQQIFQSALFSYELFMLELLTAVMCQEVFQLACFRLLPFLQNIELTLRR